MTDYTDSFYISVKKIILQRHPDAYVFKKKLKLSEEVDVDWYEISWDSRDKVEQKATGFIYENIAWYETASFLLQQELKKEKENSIFNKAMSAIKKAYNDAKRYFFI